MSSWCFETYQTEHKKNPNWHITADYCWNKCEPYSVFVGVFDNKGVHIKTLFKSYYANKESAKRSFQRQVRKIKKGDY